MAMDIIRSQLGHIHKHLKEADLAENGENAAARATAILRNPRALVVVLGAAATGIAVGAFAIVRRRKKATDARTPECAELCNASLATYLEAVHEGRLDLDIIDRLIADLDAVNTYEAEQGEVTLAISTEHVQKLLDTVQSYTLRLAEDNAIDMDEIQQRVPASENDGVQSLRRHLEVQREIFKAA